MKKLIVTTIIFLSSLQISYSQGEWFWQNPLPQGNRLESIDAISPTNLFAVGYGSTFIKSINGGISWSIKYIPFGLSPRNFFSVKFIDINTGWICGDSGAVLKTENGGNTWNWQSTNTNERLKKIFFINPQLGFICGWQGNIFKTTNGGNSWINKSISSSYSLNDVHFINSNIGFICGAQSHTPPTPDKGVLLKTTNGGDNWYEIYFPYNTDFTSLCFINDQTGYISGKGGGNPPARLFKTTNSGDNWSEIDIQVNESVWSVYFSNENIGILNTPHGLRKTTNGGLSWFWLTQVSGYSCDNHFKDFKFFSDTLFYSVRCDRIFKSTNSGNNLTEISSGHNNGHTCIQFINENTGWADYSGGIYKSINGGLNWQNIVIPGTDYGFQFHFVNANTGWIIKDPLLKTMNGGLNWTVDNSIRYVDEIHFINQTTGYFIADSSSIVKIYKTTNSGLMWSHIYSENIELKDFQFLNNDIGFCLKGITSYSYQLLKTTNGGYNWFVNSLVEINDPNNYFFINENTGWLSKRISHSILTESIYKTTNGGLNWVNQNLDYLNLHYLDIRKFFNPNTGIATASVYMLHTSNGGENWNVYYTGLENTIYDIYYINSNTGWIVSGSSILKTTNAGLGSPHDFSTGPLIDFPEVFIKDSSYHIKAKITNEGTEPETNVPIRFLINGTQVGYYLRSLPAGGIDTVDFTWIPHTAGDFNLAIASALPTDINRSNDTVKVDVRVYSSPALPIFCDDFSGGTLNWTITNDGGTCVWQAYSPPYPNAYSLPATSSGAVLSADADKCGSGTTLLSTAMIIENVDCSMFENVYLEFDNDWNAIDEQDSAIVEVSYDGGVSWSSVIEWGGTDVRNTQERCSLSGADANPNVRIRFRSIQPGWDWWWAVDNVCIKGFPLTGFTQNSGEVPTKYALMQNYPNPFNPTTKIRFDLPKSTHAKLIIYDILGREVATLVNEKFNAGSYIVDWPALTGNGSSYPSGVYFYRLQTKDFTSVKKMLLIK